MCQTRLVHYDYVVLKTNEIKVAQYLLVAVFVSLERFVLKVVYIRYVMVFYDQPIILQANPTTSGVGSNKWAVKP